MKISIRILGEIAVFGGALVVLGAIVTSLLAEHSSPMMVGSTAVAAALIHQLHQLVGERRPSANS